MLSPEGFLYSIEPLPKAPKGPSQVDLAFATEKLLDYEFSCEKICVLAIQHGAERKHFANSSRIPDFGTDAKIAAAARESGLAKLLYPHRHMKDSTLVTTVKALLGAICEDSDDEGDVPRAASCLGLGVVEQDLLGVEEFEFVPFVASVPVVGSLI
ncbi:hypothetical protein SVAN01_02883 [Stagonosporopsis vannaccii]|nr:hypothetical protein SVAN01_02883 [Stagonosporopsis vannaccii]